MKEIASAFIRVYPSTHTKIKLQAVKKGLSMTDYIEELLKQKTPTVK